MFKNALSVGLCAGAIGTATAVPLQSAAQTPAAAELIIAAQGRLGAAQLLDPNLQLKALSPCLATVHKGDLYITTQAEANAACPSAIHGDLTINPAGLETISMPLLQEVTGNLGVYIRVGDTDGSVARGMAALPTLTTVGGDLSLSVRGPATSSDGVYSD